MTVTPEKRLSVFVGIRAHGSAACSEVAIRKAIWLLCSVAFLTTQDSGDESKTGKKSGHRADAASHSGRAAKSAEIVKGPWTKEVCACVRVRFDW